MSLMLIAYSGVNPLHLTPGKLLSVVPATFGILLPLQSGACRLRQKARAIYCLAVQMLLEGAQLSQDHLWVAQAAKLSPQPRSERALCKAVVSDFAHIPGLMRLG